MSATPLKEKLAALDDLTEIKEIITELTTVSSPSTDFHFSIVTYEDYPDSYNSRECSS